MLFNIATRDVAETVKTNEVHLYMYADDMALASDSLRSLQEAFDKLVDWANSNSLELNPRKTVQKTFRKGGRLPATTQIMYKDTELTRVNSYKYLGVTLQTNGRSFTKHFKDKTAAAIIAMNEIKVIHQLSLETAIALFHIKISPIISYTIENIWEHLSKNDLALIERVKAMYLKKVLCLAKNAPSRLTYELTRQPFYIEELRLRILLPSTREYQALLQELHAKKADIWADFYRTDAMMTYDWKKPGYELRHSITRYAVHGFHHRLCRKKNYHDRDLNCVCELCGKLCERYHAEVCTKRTTSLTALCT
jgi:hypothetical protein